MDSVLRDSGNSTGGNNGKEIKGGFMGCRILEGKEYDDGRTQACFFCSTSDQAFGPIMSGREEAELFLTYLELDPRQYGQNELMNQYSDFVHKYVCECGGLRDEMDSEMRSQDVNGPCTCEGYIDSEDACAYCKDVYAAQNAELTERFVCYICTRKLRENKGRTKFPPSHFKQRSKYAAEPIEDQYRREQRERDAFKSEVRQIVGEDEIERDRR